MRNTFMGNPILCDLILIRSAPSPRTAHMGAQQIEKAIAGLVEAGLSAEEAFDTYSEYGFDCILCNTSRLIEQRSKSTGQQQKSTSAGRKENPRN
jgi:hypothetical protein